MPQFYTDPSIATRAVAQQQQQLDPMEGYAKALSLREMLDRQQDRGMQRQAAQQQLAERKAINQLYLETNGDLDKMAELGQGRGLSFETIESLRGAAVEKKHKAATLTKEQREGSLKQLELIGAGAVALLDVSPEERPAFYSAVKPKLSEMLGMQLPDEVPDETDLRAYVMMSEKGRAELKAADAAKIERPGKQAKSAQDQFSLAAQSLGNSKTQAEWTRKRAFLANRVDPDTLGLIPEQFSPEAAAEVRQLAAQLPKEGTLSDFEAAFQRDYGRPPTTKELVAHKRDMAQAGRAVIGGGNQAGEVADYAQSVAEGQMAITNVPIKLRGKVNSFMRENGWTAVSEKEREAIQGLDTPLAIIDDIAKYADRINTREGIGARVGGAYRSTKAFAGYDPDVKALQSKVGTLSLLIRGLGEKGTLAEGDVQRAIALIPSETDTKTEKDNKLRDLRGIFAAAKKVKLRGTAQTFPQGGVGAGTPPPGQAGQNPFRK